MLVFSGEWGDDCRMGFGGRTPGFDVSRHDAELFQPLVRSPQFYIVLIATLFQILINCPIAIHLMLAPLAGKHVLSEDTGARQVDILKDNPYESGLTCWQNQVLWSLFFYFQFW